MKPLSFMLIAGETSGDMLAADLVGALRDQAVRATGGPTDDVQPLHTALAPRFFGAGGSRMAEAGVELAFDLTQHSVIGISEVLANYLKFRRLFRQLFRLAVERQPDAIIGVDYGGFNLRFGHAIRQHVRRHYSEFTPWNPRLVQFVSPQVWASRPGRADLLAADYDLLLSIFPFEKDWYAKRAPKLRVEFVGHPMLDRFAKGELKGPRARSGSTSAADRKAEILLLPGSRAAELKRHVPVMLGALQRLRTSLPTLHARMVLPDEALAAQARSLGAAAETAIEVGGLPEALAWADVAIASTGTVTMECAFFGVPTVTLYRTSWSTYQIARRIVTVKSLTMPNLLTGEEVFPEFIQSTATPENMARAALELLQNPERRNAVKSRLAKVISLLGGPGATQRAARNILGLLDLNKHDNEKHRRNRKISPGL